MHKTSIISFQLSTCCYLYTWIMLIALGALVSNLGWTLEGFHIFLAGFVGGAVVGALNVISSLPHGNKNKIGQYLAAASAVAVLHGLLGGIVATYFNGISGSFLTGLTAIGLVLALSGNHLKKEEQKSGK